MLITKIMTCGIISLIAIVMQIFHYFILSFVVLKIFWESFLNTYFACFEQKKIIALFNLILIKFNFFFLF